MPVDFRLRRRGSQDRVLDRLVWRPARCRSGGANTQNTPAGQGPARLAEDVKKGPGRRSGPDSGGLGRNRKGSGHAVRERVERLVEDNKKPRPGMDRGCGLSRVGRERRKTRRVGKSGGGGSERDCRNRRKRRSRARASRQRAPHLRPPLPSQSDARCNPKQYLPRMGLPHETIQDIGRDCKVFCCHISPGCRSKWRTGLEPGTTLTSAPLGREARWRPRDTEGLGSANRRPPGRHPTPFSTGSAASPGPRSGSRP